MRDKIIEELHALEIALKKIGFKQSLIDPVMRAVESESLELLKESLAGERLSNYFRFLHHKVGIIGEQFVDRRKTDSGEDAARLWRHRANFQKSRIDSIMPNSEVSRALKFLIDKSFEL